MSRPFASVLVTFLVLASFSGTSEGGSISPDLAPVYDAALPGQDIPVIISLTDKADISRIRDADKHSRRSKIKKELQDKAALTQGPLKAFLAGRNSRKLKPFWIINAVAATIPKSVVSELLSFPGIESIGLDAAISSPPVTPAAVATPEWNIARVAAPDLWGLGFDGTGIVVASLDTGVDVTHPDLTARWRGGACPAPPDCPSWYDPFTASTSPYDLAGHGTHTMGTMVGGAAGGTAIGVVPGAQWIAAKIFDDSGNSLTSDAIAAMEWLLAPAGNPANAPDVVNNSWGFEQATNVCASDIALETAIQNLKTAGISVVFSAGNEGPNPSTSISPANYKDVFAIGATDVNNNISLSSSRGPSACTDRATNFPNVVAPGVNIRSSLPGGFYGSMTGTSMAAPHVAGAMALLLDAVPTATVGDLETALEQSATPLGIGWPNNDYGYGLINITGAYDFLTVPSIAVSPASRDFGPVIMASAPQTQTFTVTNRHLTGLNITGVTITGSQELSILSENCAGAVLSFPQTCSILVQFSPSSIGQKSAVLNILSNDPATPSMGISLAGAVFAALSGRTASAPALTFNAAGDLFYLAVRGTDDGIFVSTISSTGAFNNDWVRMPAGRTPDAPAIAWDPGNARLHIVVRGMDNGVFGCFIDAARNTCSLQDWVRLPTGSTPSAPAIAWNPAGSLHIVVRGMDDKIYGTTVDASMGSFSGWVRLPAGSTPSAPAIAWNPAGSLHIVVRGMDNKINGTTVDASMGSFSGWTALPGLTADAPAAALQPVSGLLHIVARQADQSLQEWGTP